ncbi:MAG: radical SAM protein [Pseudomonadota bacterium]
MELWVCEEYPCINGESLHAGRTAYLVRCGGCNLRCSFCDTPDSWADGTPRAVADVAARVLASGMDHLLLTGGEPMLQRAAAAALVETVLAGGVDAVVETNGTQPVDALPAAAVRVLDLKVPGAAAVAPFLLSNLDALQPWDQLKIVLTGRGDYDWSRAWLREHPLPIADHHVLLAPATPTLPAQALADWILEDRLPYRLQIQIHRVIWGDRKGV